MAVILSLEQIGAAINLTWVAVVCTWADTLTVADTHIMDTAKTWADTYSACDLICYIFGLT